jgi:hypothetical protein
MADTAKNEFSRMAIGRTSASGAVRYKVATVASRESFEMIGVIWLL